MELLDQTVVESLCEEIDTGPGKRQRKLKVFDSYEDPHERKRTRVVKKQLRTKNMMKKDKEKETRTKTTTNKPKEKRKIVFIHTPVDTKVLPSVALSHINKASQLTLSEDQMTCFGCNVTYQNFTSDWKVKLTYNFVLGRISNGASNTWCPSWWILLGSDDS